MWWCVFSLVLRVLQDGFFQLLPGYKNETSYDASRKGARVKMSSQGASDLPLHPDQCNITNVQSQTYLNRLLQKVKTRRFVGQSGTGSEETPDLPASCLWRQSRSNWLPWQGSVSCYWLIREHEGWSNIHVPREKMITVSSKIHLQPE